MEYTKIYYICKKDKIPFYIGKSNRLQGRISSHKKIFGKDITLEIIDEVPLNEWKFWEKYWINQFKNWGFNLKNKNNGGGGATKQNFSPLRSKKISKSRLGKPMPHKGKKLTQEHKNKIKQTRSFLKNRKNTWQISPVIQYSLDGKFVKEWESQTEATKFLNKTGDGIGACCRGKQKTAYGYIWEFKNKNKTKTK